MKKYLRTTIPFALAALVLAFSSCQKDPGPGDNGTGGDNSGGDGTGGDNSEILYQPGPEDKIVLYDNFDKAACSSGVWFDSAPAYWNPVGSGVGAQKYESSYAKLNNAFKSMNYPGASGQNNIYFTQAGSCVKLKDIAVPREGGVFRLSLAVNNPAAGNAVEFGKDIRISLFDENSASGEQLLNFASKQYAKWVMGVSVFEIVSSGTGLVSIKIEAVTAQLRVDDVRLEISELKPEQSFSFGSAIIHDYPERPKALVSNSSYKYIDHRARTFKTNREVRNYEACYDTRRHNPVWVAFPSHDIYIEGGSKRPSVDPWRPDPQMSDDEQSVIYESDWDMWPNNTHAYWTASSQGALMGRGHLLPSMDRGCGNANVLLLLNTQTFYPTNIAPERYLNTTATESHWGKVELARTYWRCSDTLYVVVGCHYEHDNWTIYDHSVNFTTTPGSKLCVVPTARYLLLLRTKTGSTGKPVWECREDQLMTIGFWFPQTISNSVLETLPSLKDYICSVSEIEKRIGGEFEFFPEVPSSVKSSYNIDDWSGLRNIL